MFAPLPLKLLDHGCTRIQVEFPTDTYAIHILLLATCLAGRILPIAVGLAFSTESLHTAALLFPVATSNLFLSYSSFNDARNELISSTALGLNLALLDSLSAQSYLHTAPCDLTHPATNVSSRG